MANVALLETFTTWGAQLAASGPSDVTIEVFSGPQTNNPTARIDISNEHVFARITLWADVSFVVEAIDAATAEMILWRAGDGLDDSRFNLEFNDVLSLFAI
ncbi:hypothetical protein M2360_003958 [Rhizobium sp. SG_E_25_P2]|uniref:immunity protein TriTu family protein n=1 Tax=Rhizobium sp. SG_E_25_P2 TaxID=2879942 RepID=UPI002473CDBC|nr:hypothetical protein [Rhizobium sp. SG_E_25_P2]MDH6268552.1 hypothetical protein [Rhizobium sp. SG_E_25_P2]